MSTFKDVLQQDSNAAVSDTLKMFFLRRGSGDFPRAFADRVSNLNVREIVWMCQSESDGNISLTCLYR